MFECSLGRSANTRQAGAEQPAWALDAFELQNQANCKTQIKRLLSARPRPRRTTPIVDAARREKADRTPPRTLVSDALAEGCTILHGVFGVAVVVQYTSR